MPINVSIKNVPDDLATALKNRAKANHRSMQREVLAILDEAVHRPQRMTIDELLSKVRKLNLQTPSESAEIVRKMRDERYGR